METIFKVRLFQAGTSDPEVSLPYNPFAVDVTNAGRISEGLMAIKVNKQILSSDYGTKYFVANHDGDIVSISVLNAEDFEVKTTDKNGNPKDGVLTNQEFIITTI